MAQALGGLGRQNRPAERGFNRDISPAGKVMAFEYSHFGKGLKFSEFGAGRLECSDLIEDWGLYVVGGDSVRYFQQGLRGQGYGARD